LINTTLKTAIIELQSRKAIYILVCFDWFRLHSNEKVLCPSKRRETAM